MKQLLLVMCAALALSACARGERDVSQEDPTTLQRVDGFLKRAFASSRTEMPQQSLPVGGGLCGDPMMVGEVVGAVPGEKNGCGIENAIRLRSVAGVALSQPSLVDCTTANALRSWIETGVRPALGDQGGGVTSLKVAAHYVCRTRNHKAGAKISEHGKGRAIDISAIRFADGSEITVQDDWGSGRNGKALRQMHQAACGPFGTVLGPGSDGYHEDHFHFDTARHRGGSYCR